MSLQTERVLLESKINALEKERRILFLEVDMYVVNIRMETSPSLEVEDINVDKIKLAVSLLDKTVVRIREITAEILRLSKSL